ncbi:hypothetical protein ACI5KX_07235 [Erythrobacter sp. GH1-10]|uniref:hypothetical protein n=1 Tax=Erythrobacter sp. GH1-10 TaxID=3349334 RepID=UPI003877E370
MINRKILRMSDEGKHNVELTVTTDCVPLLTVVGVAGVRPVPIAELVTEGTTGRRLVDDDYAMYVICTGQAPDTKITAKVVGKSGGEVSDDATVDQSGEGLLRLGFRVAAGVVS